MSRVISIVAAVAVAVSTLAALAQPAAAHERRMVGPYQLVVGWLNEPAFAGQPNSLDLRVTDTRVTPAKAVEGLEKTLRASLFFGGLTTPYSAPMTARFGTPGAYSMSVIPTSDGSYKFKIAGKIEALDVDQTFESGPTTFGDVEALGAVQYPQRVPGGADLSRELGELRATAEVSRLAAIAALVLAVASLALALRPRRT